VSVPHAAAFLSRPSGRQVVAGWYACFFSLPRITERLLHSEGDASGLSKLMQRFGQPREAADRDALVMAQPGTLTAALNWYRANWVSLLREARISITVPTMYIWSDGDTAVLGKAARNCGRHVSGEYRFEILQGSHWLLDEQPGTLAALLSEWLAAHPSITSA
jgi:pimeloyl-ACP methyl ester carboxylesterase